MILFDKHFMVIINTKRKQVYRSHHIDILHIEQLFDYLISLCFHFFLRNLIKNNSVIHIFSWRNVSRDIIFDETYHAQN